MIETTGGKKIHQTTTTGLVGGRHRFLMPCGNTQQSKRGAEKTEKMESQPWRDAESPRVKSSLQSTGEIHCGSLLGRKNRDTGKLSKAGWTERQKKVKQETSFSEHSVFLYLLSCLFALLFFKLFVIIFNFSLLWRLSCVHEIWSYIVPILDHTSLNMVFSQLIQVYRDEGPSIHQSMRIAPVEVPSGY